MPSYNPLRLRDVVNSMINALGVISIEPTARGNIVITMASNYIVKEL